MLDFLSPPKIVSDARDALRLFILLSSEKDEQRSTAAVIGLNGLPPWSPLGSAEFAFAQTVLALFPPSPLRLHRPIKAGTFSVFESFSNPSVTACHLPYILHSKTPRKATGHGRGGGEILLTNILTLQYILLGRWELEHLLN